MTQKSQAAHLIVRISIGEEALRNGLSELRQLLNGAGIEKGGAVNLHDRGRALGGNPPPGLDIWIENEGEDEVPREVPAATIRSEAGIPGEIIRRAEVVRMTGLSRSTIYHRISLGQFPRQIELGQRAVGWLREDIEMWIRSRPCRAHRLGR